MCSPAKFAHKESAIMSNQKVTEDQIIASLYNFAGNVSMAADDIGITSQALYQRRQKSGAIAQAVIDARRQLVDEAERVIKHHLGKNNLTAAIYTAKTQGRKRGWDENPDRGGGGPLIGSVTINVTEVQPPPALPAGDEPLTIDHTPGYARSTTAGDDSQGVDHTPGYANSKTTD